MRKVARLLALLLSSGLLLSGCASTPASSSGPPSLIGGPLGRTSVTSEPSNEGEIRNYRKFQNGVTCEYPGTDEGRAEAERISHAIDPIENTSFAVRHYDTEVTCISKQDDPFFSASTIKVATVAAMLWQHEQAGTEPSEYLLQTARMSIVVSDNDAQQAIWDVSGGVPAMTEFFAAAGMESTVPEVDWGLTLITSHDYLTLIDHLVNRTLLNEGHSAFLLGLMSEVDPEQAWGISGGAPEGSRVMLKNGWLYLFEGQVAGDPVPPAPAESPYGYAVTWTVNSGGYIESPEARYSMVVLTDLNVDYGSGSQLATDISTKLAAALLS